MAETTIEWTRGPNGEKGFTFNPWIGCTKVGPGCDHCYAEAGFDKRLKVAKWGAGQPRKRTSPGTWLLPLRWNAEAERLGVRYRVFCASLADVFDNEVPAEWRADLFHLIEQTPHLDWLLVTKRVGNVRQMIPDRWSVRMPLNLWLGITVANQAEADRDIPKLLSLKVAVRFLSMEPLLGPVDLTRVQWPEKHKVDVLRGGAWDLPGWHGGFTNHSDMETIDWIIVGGESGAQARPMHPQWVRDIHDQCAAAGVPFFFKQWGEWAPGVCPDDPECSVEYVFDGYVRRVMSRVGKKHAGRLFDGVEHNGCPEVPR